MSKNKELVKNTVIMTVGKLFTQFLSFFLLPLYTHFLPADEYGATDLILSYISLLAPVITVHQEMAAFRYLIDARKDEKKQSMIIVTSIKSTLLRLLVFIIPYLIATFFFESKYKYLVLVAGVCMSIAHLLLQISRGLGDNIRYTIGSVISGAVTLISNVILICVLHLGGESILISMALGNLLCSIYLFVVLTIPHHIKNARSDSVLRKEMLKYSWPLVPNGISWWLINTSDRTIVSIFLGVAANGIYAVVVKIPTIISGFLGIFVLSWTESASLHINDSDRDEFFSSVAKNTLRLFSSLSILLIAIIPFVFDIVVGSNYHEAYTYIPIAILGVLFNCMVSIYSAIYVAKKMTKKVATTSLFSAIINLVVDLALIKLVGLYAAVISTAVAYLTMTIYRHFDLKKYIHIKYEIVDLIMTLFGFILIFIIYYSGNTIWQVIGLALASIYVITQNRRLIKKIVANTLKRKKL